MYQNELYHHGILGMKWGKRSGPPYPLGASDHSASEKKAGYQKSIDSGKSSDPKMTKRSTKPMLKSKPKEQKPSVKSLRDVKTSATSKKSTTAKSKPAKPRDPEKFINDYKKTVRAYQAANLFGMPTRVLPSKTLSKGQNAAIATMSILRLLGAYGNTKRMV